MEVAVQETGRSRLAAAFAGARARRLAALMPYYTLGYPDPDASLAVLRAIAPLSDILELGVPFSDPIADGPTIQQSTQTALEAGTTLRGCLALVRTLRAEGIDTPALLFSYYNPLLAYGLEALVVAAAEAGVDGFVVPDLPPEEADELEALAQAAGLVLVHFLAPTSSPQRIAHVVARAQGFIYMVSVTGITGARSTLHGDLAPFVARIRAAAQVPVAVGFGISTPALARQVAHFADGVIVGSALINAVATADDKPAAAAAFVQALANGLAPEAG